MALDLSNSHTKSSTHAFILAQNGSKTLCAYWFLWVLQVISTSQCRHHTTTHPPFTTAFAPSSFLIHHLYTLFTTVVLWSLQYSCLVLFVTMNTVYFVVLCFLIPLPQIHAVLSQLFVRTSPQWNGPDYSANHTGFHLIGFLLSTLHLYPPSGIVLPR